MLRSMVGIDVGCVDRRTHRSDVSRGGVFVKFLVGRMGRLIKFSAVYCRMGRLIMSVR